MNSTQHIEICALKPEQYSELLTVMKKAYPNWQGSYWSEKSIQKLTQIFLKIFQEVEEKKKHRIRFGFF